MCLHAADYEIDGVWHFFGTSHGKSACDGVGGTVKRLIARLSLQGQTITTAKEMFDVAKKEISGIRYIINYI